MAILLKRASAPKVVKEIKPEGSPPAVPPIGTVMATYNPMLAAEAVLGQINYPMMALPKHNGVRGENQGGELLARSLKPIPNLHTRELFSGKQYASLGGELVVGDPFDEEVFTISTHGVMTREGTPDVAWYLFDMYHPSLNFENRIQLVHDRVASLGNSRVQAIPFHLIRSDDELEELSATYLGMGFEGLVLRDPRKPYKTGRSTAKEQGFMRYCPWLRSEAIILELHEGVVNKNESKRNELGYLKKSSHQENLVGSGRIGAVTVKDIKTGITFNMSVPTVALQDHMMKFPEKYINKIVKYKFKPAVKKGGKPRFPQWEGLRAPEDM